MRDARSFSSWGDCGPRSQSSARIARSFSSTASWSTARCEYADRARARELQVEDPAPVAQRAQGALHVELGHVHLGVAVALLVARQHERVERQRVRLGDRELLLDEAAEDAPLRGIELDGHGCGPRAGRPAAYPGSRRGRARPPARAGRSRARSHRRRLQQRGTHERRPVGRREAVRVGEEARPVERRDRARGVGERAEEVVVVAGQQELRAQALAEALEVARRAGARGEARDQDVGRALARERERGEARAALDVERAARAPRRATRRPRRAASGTACGGRRWGGDRRGRRSARAARRRARCGSPRR